MLRMQIISAIFYKQCKDSIKNVQTLILYFMFPGIAFAMIQAMGEMSGEASFFLAIFATMHVVFTPLVTATSIVAEEKEKNTLRVLMMSNVNPFEYLLSIGGFIFLFTMLTGCSFLCMNAFSITEMLVIFSFMMLGTLCSIMLGISLGCYFKNPVAANAVAVPISLVVGFLPMLAKFNASVEAIAKYTFGQQISMILEQPMNVISTESMMMLVINVVIILVIFIVCFRGSKLAE